MVSPNHVLRSPERTKLLEELDQRWYRGERIVRHLNRWHVTNVEFLGKEFLSVPPPAGLEEALNALNISLPAKAIHLRNASGTTSA